jgi:hypothetical protein
MKTLICRDCGEKLPFKVYDACPKCNSKIGFYGPYGEIDEPANTTEASLE